MTETTETTETQQDWYSGDNATFGDRLTAAREAQGMTINELARRLGVKMNTIEAWENDTSEPRANKLQMVAGLLNVSIRWLLTGEGEGVSEPVTPEEMAQDAIAVLREVQQMRQQMTHLATRMGKAEKRLRVLLKEAF